MMSSVSWMLSHLRFLRWRTRSLLRLNEGEDHRRGLETGDSEHSISSRMYSGIAVLTDDTEELRGCRKTAICESHQYHPKGSLAPNRPSTCSTTTAHSYCGHLSQVREP